MPVAEKIKERRKLIINMLTLAPGNRVYGTDIRNEICGKFGKEISKATLSSDMKALALEGYEIAADTEGYRLLNPEFKSPDPETAGFEPVTRDTVAQWIIMVILSGNRDKYMSARDIYNEYINLTEVISMNKLKKLLDGLVDMKFISRHTRDEVWEAGQSIAEDSGKSNNKLFYHICDSAPVISFIDKEAVMDFNAYYHDGGYAEELGDTLRTINEKIAAVCPEIYEETSGVYKSTGRRNDIPEESEQKLESMLRLPFQNYALDIKYLEKEKSKDYIFKTALIIFNVETNTFYLLGEVRIKGKWIRRNLKLSAVTQMSVNESIRNDICESKKYREIFSKMWSAAPDEPCDVEVLFEDSRDIRDEIRMLRQARNDTATVTFQDNGWIRYRDRIMGTHDFLRFVRSMGDAAVILKPEKSRKHLTDKTKEMIDGYREILGYE